MDFLNDEALKKDIIGRAEQAVKERNYAELNTCLQILSSIAQLNSYNMLSESIGKMASSFNPDDLQAVLNKLKQDK